MIALQYSQFGEPAQVITAVEVPIPVPRAGQALVRVVRSPIHNHDLATIRGVYGVRPQLPAIGGSELLGLLADGKRVACTTQGAWAEHALVESSSLVPVPEGIPDDEACQLLAMPLSALMLLDDLNVGAGDWIALNAANGAVGRILIREAQQKGVNVVGLVRSERSAEQLRACGAEHVVVTEGTWTERVRDLSGGAPIVRAIDSVAGAQSLQLQRLLAPRGELVVFGGLAAEPMRLDPGLMISGELIVRGFWMSALARRPENAQRIARAAKRVFDLAREGELALATEGVYSLAEAAQALAAAQTPGRTGKVLFAPRRK